jgi:hypothetical protein
MFTRVEKYGSERMPQVVKANPRQLPAMDKLVEPKRILSSLRQARLSP